MGLQLTAATPVHGEPVAPVIKPQLEKFIATRDRRIEKSQPWRDAPLKEAFQTLLSKGSVTVGGRSTCGAGAADPTWVVFGYWNEIVSKARKLGYQITEQAIKQGNAWATKNRGFWHESEYQLISSGGAV